MAQRPFRALRLLAVAVAVIAAGLLAGGGAAAAPRPAPDPGILAEFHALRMFIATRPTAALMGGERMSLGRKVENAEAAYVRGQVCTAVNLLNAYLNEARALRQGKRVPMAEDLYNRGRALRDAVTAGAVPPDPCANPALGRPPLVHIGASDNSHFQASVAFGAPRMWSVGAGGETWTQLELPAVQSVSGIPGLPAVPMWRALVAVPHGATAVLNAVGPPEVAETILLNLYPFQPDAADQRLPGIDPEFADPPFSKDAATYETDAFFPLSPNCAVTPLGQHRDVQMAQVLCAGGQYNPVTDELRLFSSVQFDIAFEGGDGNFVTSQSLSPFEVGSRASIASALNSAVVADYVRAVDILPLPCFGEELLILTHPDFRAAADDLAQWKRDKGIATTVIEVGAGTPYDTAAEIDDLIEGRYDDCMVRLSYVLILGDAEFVPPARTDYDTTGAYCGTCGDVTTGSDWGYSVYVQILFDAFFPDFGVARIPADTAEEAQVAVDKIIGYESSPPMLGFGAGGPFYTTSTIASQFQCCRMNVNGSPLNNQAGTDQRAFVETSEVARNTMLAAGHTVERIYMETVDTGGQCTSIPCPPGLIQQPYNGDTTPRRYYNAALLPADLGGGSGFAWNGTTQDIIDAWNEGRFLVLHRDHGSSSGFANPSFQTGNIASLTNGALLPVVYSVNCASGYFDLETDTGAMAESLMELLLLKEGGGMVGGLGDVRNSPTWPNNALTRGFFDATWPDLAPEFGDGSSTRRLGDILNHGKVYLLTQVGVVQTAGSVTLDAAIAENIMWHAFGDPTLEMWTGNPWRIVLPLAFELQVRPERLVVAYSIEGAEITALQVTEGGILPVGRGMVRGGMAEVMFFHPPEEGAPIRLSASLPNAVSVLLTPEGLPDLVLRDLALDSPVLAPGDDLASRLSIVVGNLGDAVAPGTVNPDGSVKGGGIGYMIDLVLSLDAAMPPGFAPLADDNTFAEDELLKGGRVSRTPDVPAGGSVPLSTGPPIGSDIGGLVPLAIAPGEYYLCGRIDPGNAVPEIVEDNNVLCVPVTVVVTLPRD